MSSTSRVKLNRCGVSALRTAPLRAGWEIGGSIDGWEAARPRLRWVIATSDHLLAGWGIRGLAGQTAAWRRAHHDPSFTVVPRDSYEIDSGNHSPARATRIPPVKHA